MTPYPIDSGCRLLRIHPAGAAVRRPWFVWAALGVGFGRPVAVVVSLVLVCLVRVWYWFRPPVRWFRWS